MANTNRRGEAERKSWEAERDRSAGGYWAWVSERDLEFKDFSWGVGLELTSYFVS